ncbi:MAG: fatty acid hydroxylase, partial [Chitinophagaceae bacterium]|nr:fatty acid hydroxylase [Chitinophagaceae bacterium]
SFVLVFLSVFLDNYFTLVDGFVTGFTCYSFMHIMLHMKWSGKLFPQLHEFHIHHHCKYPDKCFGITFTWWDHLFGTIPLKDAAITERIRAFYYKNENSNRAIANKFHQTCRQTEMIGKKISVSGDQEPEIPGSNNNTENDSCEKYKNASCPEPSL